MNEPTKSSANGPTPPSRAPEGATATVQSTPAASDDAMSAYMAHARALLNELGPADAMRVLREAKRTMPTPAKSDDLDDEDEDDGDDELEDGDDGGEGEEDAAEPDELLASRAATARRGKKRLVAGMFEVSPRVESCRLRVVNEMGERGEPVGHINEQGIEQTEWPLGVMTAERLRSLTRGRGGKYLFEWLGRNAKGQRVGLGRSQEFRMQGDRTQKARPSAEAAPLPAVPNDFQQFFAMQKYQDERRDIEDARKERASEREAELLMLRARLESKERMQAMTLQVRQAEAEPPSPRLNEAAVAAFIDRKVAERLEEVGEQGEEGDEVEIPKWLRALGLDEDTLSVAKPFLKNQLANLPALLAKLGMQPSAPVEPLPAPYAPPPRKATKFVPKGGTE